MSQGFWRLLTWYQDPNISDQNQFSSSIFGHTSTLFFTMVSRQKDCNSPLKKGLPIQPTIYCVTYCCWKKSYTSWYHKYPHDFRISHVSTWFGRWIFEPSPIIKSSNTPSFVAWDPGEDPIGTGAGERTPAVFNPTVLGEIWELTSSGKLVASRKQWTRGRRW